MLRDGGDELFGCVYPEVLPVPAVGHLRFVDDGTGFVVVDNICNRKGIADYILGDPFSRLVIVSCDPYGIMHAETGMSPAHEIIDDSIGIPELISAI